MGLGQIWKKLHILLKKTNIIEVEWRFPNALRKIIQHHDKYALYLIDRNLSEDDYDYKEIKQIDPSYNEKLYDRFF